MTEESLDKKKSNARLDWHILTLEATKESARSIWMNEQLAFYKELRAFRAGPKITIEPVNWKPIIPMNMDRSNDT